ncbi:LOW QUALITY PROTEIN: Mitotic-spindle organizing protein 2B, partial [Galemys pyrenaicus]
GCREARRRRPRGRRSGPGEGAAAGRAGLGASPAGHAPPAAPMAALGAGPGPGPGGPPGLEAALQKLALRRKKVLSAEEMELYELAQAAGGAMDPDVFKILVDLLKLNVAPLAVFQMLKSMCAGQRLASEAQDPVAMTLPTSSLPEIRGQSWAWCSLAAGSDTGGEVWAVPGTALAWPSVTRPALGTDTQASSLTHTLSALFVSLSDLQRPPFSLPRTVAPLQGLPFPRPHGLQPLRFYSTAQLPRTRLSLQGPPVPSGSLAACSLLLQVAFIGLSLGVVYSRRNKGSTALGGGSALAERSSRDGSSQRMPRQPSATRLPKGCGPGKSPPQSST